MHLTFAEQVRKILKERDLTIEQFAEIMGISRQNLNQKLNRNNFDERTMRAIAIALGCDYFISLNGMNIDKSRNINSQQQQQEKHGPGRPNKHKEIEEEIKGALLSNPSIPEGLKEVIKTTPLKRNETAEEYRKRLDVIKFNRYINETSISTDVSRENAIMAEVLNDPEIPEELKTVAKTLAVEPGETLDKYLDRLIRVVDGNGEGDESSDDEVYDKEIEDLELRFPRMDGETKAQYAKRIIEIKAGIEK